MRLEILNLKPTIGRLKVIATISSVRSFKYVVIIASIALASTVFVGTETKALSLHDSASWKPELGFNVVLGDNQILSDSHELSQAKAVFSYAASLGANSVILNFNFYQTGQTPSNPAQNSDTMSSGPGTPSPELLTAIVESARAIGLQVQLRPVLSQEGDVFGVANRSSIEPNQPSKWFQSYAKWLRPYLYVASKTGVSSFCLGTEMSSLVSGRRANSGATQNFLPEWLKLTQMASSIFHGNLLYAASHASSATVPGILFGFDAYSKIALPTGTTDPTSSTPLSTVVSEFLPGLTTNYALETAGVPSQTRVEEIGIPAEVGSWLTPSFYSYYPVVVARWVQEAWITANCNVMISNRMKGFYIWAIDLQGFSPSYNADVANDPYNFIGTATENSIRSCFAAAKSAA